MVHVEILEAIKKLPTTERLAVVEAALRLTREDLQGFGVIKVLQSFGARFWGQVGGRRSLIERRVWG
jgi:hypothetical protein